MLGIGDDTGLTDGDTPCFISLSVELHLFIYFCNLISRLLNLFFDTAKGELGSNLLNSF